MTSHKRIWLVQRHEREARDISTMELRPQICPSRQKGGSQLSPPFFSTVDTVDSVDSRWRLAIRRGARAPIIHRSPVANRFSPVVHR